MIPGRICIVMMSAVGDAVHVLPLVNAIKRQSPGTRITWVLQPGPATLVRGHPSVDEIVVFERSRGGSAYVNVLRSLRSRSFDLLIDLQVYFKAGLVAALSGVPRRLGFDRARARDLNWLFTTERIPPHPVQHVQDQYFEFARYLGVEPEPVEWKLGPWPDERAWQQQFRSRFDRPIASIVVGTSKPEKDWLPERWAKVCKLLIADFGMQPVLVGGGTERERHAVSVIQREIGGLAYDALGSGLRRLVGILDASELVLSPDTGPLHMAVALDRPLISLIGYADPRRTGPYRRFGDLIIDAFHGPEVTGPVTMETRSDRMARISVADVAARIALWAERYRGKS